MEAINLTEYSIDELEQLITSCEARIGQMRTVQMRAIRQLDRLQAPLTDGCRSMGEWVTGRLDVATDTAKTLVATAKRLEALPTVEEAAAAGEISFDRTVAVARLGDDTAIDTTAGLDIAGMHRKAAQQRRLTRRQEQQLFRDQYVATQPNLDHTAIRLHGQLVGVAARVVEDALHHVGDQLPATTEPRSRTTRNAHALWKLSQDALDGTNDSETASTPLVTVFIDATETAATNAETGVTVEAGMRVGPNTLEAMVCTAAVEVTAITDDGTPLNLGRKTRVVSPQLRRYVLHRDGGRCTADGCDSRYRLEAHHITPWSQGGRTDADNLTTLCWYHHHVVIHGEGYGIDPESPPCRRRFKPPRDHDPP